MTELSNERLVEMLATSKSREEQMVVIEHDEAGKPTIYCDPEIVDLVTALNAGHVPTIASCSGHGHRPGNPDGVFDDMRATLVAAISRKG